MNRIDVLTQRQDLLKAINLLYNKIITPDEFDEIRQSYLDIYLLYMEH